MSAEMKRSGRQKQALANPKKVCYVSLRRSRWEAQFRLFD